jgi:hypothetical protein
LAGLAIAAAFALAAALGAALGTAAGAGAVTPPVPTPGTARLQGQFALTGRVTVAKNVRGEHVGQQVKRTWIFTPQCPVGACQTISLVRRRGAGSDSVQLRRRSPGYYVGTGSFFAPLQCGRDVWRRGASVPFTITVRVTAAALAGSEVVATRISASYTNRARVNRTPCVAVLGHDAATYRGTAVPPPSTVPGAQ